MTAQPRLQFRTVALDPAPDCRVVRFQAALAEQFFDIAERERVPQIPAHSAQNHFGLGLSPLEDRRSDCLFHDLFSLQGTVGQSCNTTPERIGTRPAVNRKALSAAGSGDVDVASGVCYVANLCRVGQSCNTTPFRLEPKVSRSQFKMPIVRPPRHGLR